jgi:NAD(P)H-hydrate epimerase
MNDHQAARRRTIMMRTLSREEVRAVDQRAIQQYGLPGVVLMENAGRGAAELLISLGIGGLVVVCAGKGNNAGDGFVIARHLEIHGYQVRVLLFCDPSELRGDAEINYRVIEKAGTPIRCFAAPPDDQELQQELAAADWIVDALLGTGTQGQIREPYTTVIEAVNRAPARVLAVDLPSGLDCDSGEPLGACIRADHTATFVAPKLGFEKESAGQFTGAVHVIGIGVPRGVVMSDE